MAKKTNKTSHVMDLLTNGAETEEPVADSAAPAQEGKSDVQSHTVTPAKVTVVDEGSRNDRLSQEILGKLTEELEEETRQEQEALEASAARTAGGESPRPEDGQSPQQSIEEAQEAVSQVLESALDTMADTAEPTSEHPDSQSPDSSDSVSQDSQPQAHEEPDSSGGSAEDTQPHEEPAQEPHPIIPESQMSRRVQNKEYRFVNVMEQLLMRQDLDAVLKQHNVCNCPRCMSDVCALALTGLPSKYVVTSKDSISPLLSYYENKYKIPVLTELMKACNKVRENPRHRKAPQS
ncbi:MAG: hypothetical protein HFG74_03965 [Hungatella sp.]|nr:hypothetical protein [Hungatella sp.]